jgi:hypothetical protein
MTNYIEQIPDGVKVAVAGSAPVAGLFGLTVVEWSYTLSSIVALLFILEKLYKFYKWCRSRQCTQQTNG